MRVIGFGDAAVQYNISIGRLTLKVLLSFSQFEREVTSECIRDKIDASRSKGLWVGGNVALRYAPKDASS